MLDLGINNNVQLIMRLKRHQN